VITTPHLGSVDYRAQLGSRDDDAEQVIDYLKHARCAARSHAFSERGASRSDRALHHAWPKIGLFQGQVFGHDLREVAIEYSGEVTEHDVKPITQGGHCRIAWAR